MSLRKILIFFTLLAVAFILNNGLVLADQNAVEPVGLPGITLIEVSAQPSILFYKDFEVGNDVFDDALANLGLAYTFTNDPTTFANLLNGQVWGCVIALQQNYGGGMPFDTPLANYIAGGGRALLADWRMNGTLAAAFEGAYTGSNNQTPITTDAHQIWNGLPATVGLANPGWGTWDMGLSPIGGGVATGSFPNGDAAVIVGNGGRTLLNSMLSDTFANHAEGVIFAENEISFFCFAPDLVTTSLSAEIVNILSTKIRTIEVTYRVQNQGNADAGPSQLLFFLSLDQVLSMDDVFVGFVDIPGLAVGEETLLVTERFRVVVSALNSWYLIALTDSGNELAVPLMK